MPNLASTRNIKYERRVRALFIEKGMFICRLDRPWMDTPLWLQGFLLTTDQELNALRQYCESVYIDISRGIEAEHYMEENLELPTNDYLEKQFKKKNHHIRYANKVSLKDELSNAQDVLEIATGKFDLVMDNIKDGKKLGLKLIPSLLQPMIDSVIRNSDALLLLSRLRSKKNLTYFHAIDACVLALVFGRFMGLPLRDIHQLGTGALLLDIGKVNVPVNILNKKEQLTSTQYAIVCTHVDHGVNFLKLDENLHEDIVNMVLAHHERSDGSGYPNGLKQIRIPAYAKIASVIDCYNAMSSKRPFKDAIIPYDALQQIYNLRQKYFQPELVEKFLHCLGIYPNGSLIEFNTGEVGVVLSQNHSSRLKPQVLPLLNASKKPYRTFKIIDMIKKPVTKNGNPLSIVHALEQHAYGIDLSSVYGKLKTVVPEQKLPKINTLSNNFHRAVFYIEELWAQFLSKFKSKKQD